MASSHDQHHGAATAGHEDAHADDGHDAHAEEKPGWVLIPLGIGAAIAVVLILVLGVQPDVPERTEPIGATKTEADEHGATADDEHEAEEDSAEEESTPTTHE